MKEIEKYVKALQAMAVFIYNCDDRDINPPVEELNTANRIFRLLQRASSIGGRVQDERLRPYLLEISQLLIAFFQDVLEYHNNETDTLNEIDLSIIDRGILELDDEKYPHITEFFKKSIDFLEDMSFVAGIRYRQFNDRNNRLNLMENEIARLSRIVSNIFDEEKAIVLQNLLEAFSFMHAYLRQKLDRDIEYNDSAFPV